MVILITPVVEVDGRDRMVDIYKWHKAHPKENYPRLAYWGHYVAHDNNRDAMAMTLALTNNILNTYLGWHARYSMTCMSRSRSFMTTLLERPLNAWIDPLLADEWAALGWNNVRAVAKLRYARESFTHGNFDTWSPGYLMFLAGLHNGISRLYETFGNGGADTVKRILSPDQYSRTWYRQNPPYLPCYGPSAITITTNKPRCSPRFLILRTIDHFLENFYLKSKRSIERPVSSGPAAYVLPKSEAAVNRQLQLLRVLASQHVEVSRLEETASITLPRKTTRQRGG